MQFLKFSIQILSIPMRILDRLTIRSKLILMLIAVSSCSIFVIATVGYRSGKANLTARVFNQLTSLRAAKADRIEVYFETIRNQSKIFSEDFTVIAALMEFQSAYNKLESSEITPDLDQKIDTYYTKEFFSRLTKANEGNPVLNAYKPKNAAARYLQYHYIAANPNPVGQKSQLINPKDGSQYSRIHDRYHPIFKNLVEKFGYYDLFLIDPQGNIVYTTFKEADFSTNLKSGPYSETNLAKAVAIARQAKGTDVVKLVDFEPYAPSYGAPAAFIAAPVYNQSEFIGVLAFQLPVDEINKVMTGNKNWVKNGLGETGETYLVGEDYLMRSISRFLVEDPEGYLKTLRSLGLPEATLKHIQGYKTSILQQPVKTDAVKQAFSGKEGTKIIEDYRNVPVLSSFTPLKIPDLNWVLLAEIDLEGVHLTFVISQSAR
jgi:hypothetical protein